MDDRLAPGYLQAKGGILSIPGASRCMTLLPLDKYRPNYEEWAKR